MSESKHKDLSKSNLAPFDVLQDGTISIGCQRANLPPYLNLKKFSKEELKEMAKQHKDLENLFLFETELRSLLDGQETITSEQGTFGNKEQPPVNFVVPPKKKGLVLVSASSQGNKAIIEKNSAVKKFQQKMIRFGRCEKCISPWSDGKCTCGQKKVTKESEKINELVRSLVEKGWTFDYQNRK